MCGIWYSFIHDILKFRYAKTYQIGFVSPIVTSCQIWVKNTYRKVANSSLSRLVAHFQIFRRFMKGKFDAYVLWPLAKKFQTWIVDRSTARDFMVCKYVRTKKFEKFWWKLKEYKPYPYPAGTFSPPPPPLGLMMNYRAHLKTSKPMK